MVKFSLILTGSWRRCMLYS